MGERYLKSIRLLAECMQDFERFSSDFVRQYGLTHAQFDIIATLGNTSGMSYKELGQRTLITKGTLTGVVDRLEQKGLVIRERCPRDKRSYYVRLSTQGEQVFQDVFPKLTRQGQRLFANYTDDDFNHLETTLAGLKQAIASGPSSNTDSDSNKTKETS
ncbi:MULTISPECIES: MarR family winged helix-turn-helix transcriptional regulator [unclassified Janthinobacterium]|uniref:MarR family winged helix-turn-helix transcriptional regulator n=1 Tax=unclassified Janthinobacterium TaxID=2610881 RepID=UPI001587A0B8|nr:MULTISPECIES: MarR family transcriptional regulator [unclassified Janthinobacterium]